MKMKYRQLQDLFWEVTNNIIGEYLKNPNKNIRFKYPVNGQVDWKIDENIVFINLSEKDDDYAKQIDSRYITEDGTVKRYMARTRVWNVNYTVYGPDAYDIVNQIKDGVFTQSIHDLMSRNSVFLIPNLPSLIQANEMFAGKWWQRWDLTLNFNELYEMKPDDLGHIEYVSISTQVNKK